MLYYIVRRIILITVVLLTVTIITFSLTYLAPGDPAVLWVGHRPTPAQVAQAREELGLDKPFHLRYIHYIGNLIQGDFGTAIRTRQPVIEEIKKYYPATIELVTISIVISLIFGIPLGVFSAVRRESILDHTSRVFSISGVCVPVFWLGMMMQLVFYTTIRLLPIQGRISSDILVNYPVTSITGFYLIDTLFTGNLSAFQSSILHIILPAITMALTSLAVITRISRSSMVEVMNEDYIRTAKAFGLGDNQIKYKYGLKNALIPTATVVGAAYGYSLGGSVLVESIFDWPGMGRFVWLSILHNDYPAIMACTITYAVTYLIINLIIDLIYSFIDPRIRYVEN
jgi:peptide/nickel transport system permease protein